MYARSTAMRVRPEALDDLVGYIRDDVMPMVTNSRAASVSEFDLALDHLRVPETV